MIYLIILIPILTKVKEIKLEYSDKENESYTDKMRDIEKFSFSQHIRRNAPNDIKFYKKITSILQLTSENNPSILEMGDFKVGTSRTFDSENVNGSHVFNMFIDFAYSASFNSLNIKPRECAHEDVLPYLESDEVKLNSYRAMSISVSLKRKEAETTEQAFWGDMSATKYRLYRFYDQTYNRMGQEKIQKSKLVFGKDQSEKTPVLDTFEKGVFGVASRFNLLVHRLAELMQPSIYLDSISYAEDAKMEFYSDSEKMEDIYVKSFTGGLKVSVKVKGCVGNPKIMVNDKNIELVKSEYLATSNIYDIDMVIASSELQNPFIILDAATGQENFDFEGVDGNEKRILQDGKPEDEKYQSDVKLPSDLWKYRISKEVNNLRILQLELMCSTEEVKNDPSLTSLPQSHFGRGLIDQGYIRKNFINNRLEVTTPNTVTQIAIQDISRLEQDYMVQQVFYANIDVISHYNMFMSISDESSKSILENYSPHSIDAFYQIHEDISSKYPGDGMSMFEYNMDKGEMEMTANLLKLGESWDLEVTEYADLGCCSSQSLGGTEMAVVKDVAGFRSVGKGTMRIHGTV